MIYTVISDLTLSEDLSDKLKISSSCAVEAFSCGLSNEKMPICSTVEDKSEKTENTASERDCRILRQPLSLLPESVRAYINGTVDSGVRSERCLAYVTLLSSLIAFFCVTAEDIGRSPDGKPYLVYQAAENNESKAEPPKQELSHTVALLCSDPSEKYQKNEDDTVEQLTDQKNQVFLSATEPQSKKPKGSSQIHISISHSDGVIAVSLSDEGEVGVDIQSEIPSDKANRLDKRFFTSVEPTNRDLGVEYYLCTITENEAKFEKISLTEPKITDFSSKWAFCEAVMKLYGRGFGDLSRLPELVADSSTELKEYTSFAKFTVATSIKRC